MRFSWLFCFEHVLCARHCSRSLGLVGAQNRQLLTFLDFVVASGGVSTATSWPKPPLSLTWVAAGTPRQSPCLYSGSFISQAPPSNRGDILKMYIMLKSLWGLPASLESQTPWSTGLHSLWTSAFPLILIMGLPAPGSSRPSFCSSRKPLWCPTGFALCCPLHLQCPSRLHHLAIHLFHLGLGQNAEIRERLSDRENPFPQPYFLSHDLVYFSCSH